MLLRLLCGPAVLLAAQTSSSLQQPRPGCCCVPEACAHEIFCCMLFAVPFLLTSNGQRLKMMPRLLCVPARLLPASQASVAPSNPLTLVTLVSQKQPLWRGVTQGGVAPIVQGEPLVFPVCVFVGSIFGDFGDFGVSDAATVAWRYTRRGGPRLSVQGEPLVVLTRGP